MEKAKNKTGANSFLFYLSWLLLGIIVAIFLIPIYLPDQFCFASIDYALFVGGLAGPVAALVGFIYVYLTFLGQQKQLDDQRERMDKEESSKEFADYLNLWNEFRSNVKYVYNGKTGSKAFDSYWSNVKNAVKDDSSKEGGFDIKEPKFFYKSLKRHLTTSSFNKFGQYENFLRMVYPLLESVERGKLISRQKYLENLLSGGEKAILIYSASFLDKKEFAVNLFKNGFCRDLNDRYLISPDHRKLIF